MKINEIPPLAIAGLCVLLIPALFIHLGMPAITADEPTRALVAMEMIFKQDYLISTIVGEYYYKKPPLFNWLLVAMYEITGSPSELVTRLAALIPLLLFAFRLFIVVKKHVDEQTAWLTFFIQLTFGRMLYYDSMLGHIDILYAWITFETFVWLYVHSSESKPLKFYVGFYVLHAIAFMLKGLPSLLFPIFTLAALAWQKRSIKWLLSWPHVIGICAGLAIPVVFFTYYAQYNSLTGWITQLWDQSKQRTVLDKTWWESIRHVFIFPIDHLMHLAPWSVLVVYIYKREVREKIWGQPFLRYLLWILIFNIPVYWASPGYYPRYLFMLYPIVFVSLAYAYFRSAPTVWFVMLVRFITCVVLLCFPAVVWYMNWSWYSIPFVICILLFSLLTWASIRHPQHAVWTLVGIMLVTRLVFNWYVIPHRTATGNMERNKQEALEIARLTHGNPLYISYPGSSSEHYHYYYIERERNAILKYKEPDTTSFFIYWPGSIPGVSYDTLYTFDMDYENTVLHLVKFTHLPDSLQIPDSKRMYLLR